jgi:hypothetical protein
MYPLSRTTAGAVESRIFLGQEFQGHGKVASLGQNATDFCVDRICMSPPLGMTTSLTGGEHLSSFGRKICNYPLDA